MVVVAEVSYEGIRPLLMHRNTMLEEPSRGARIYWTLFGGTHHFFSGKEAAEAERPRLIIDGVNTQADIIRVSVTNIGGSVAKDAYGKITIEIRPEDVIDGRDLIPPLVAFTTPKDYGEIRGSNLSWRFSKNPAKINIARGISEMLMVVKLERNKVGIPRQDILNIPSEEGFSDAESIEGIAVGDVFAKSRVILKARTYTGTLTIGADDVAPSKETTKAFKLVYSDINRILELVLMA